MPDIDTSRFSDGLMANGRLHPTPWDRRQGLWRRSRPIGERTRQWRYVVDPATGVFAISLGPQHLRLLCREYAADVPPMCVKMFGSTILVM